MIVNKNVIRQIRDVFCEQFEIICIATMSAGKSTLINALLGEPLLPSKNMACTGKVMRIINIKELPQFQIRLKSQQGAKTEQWEIATLNQLKVINELKANICVDIRGDIPYIHSQYGQAVLIDTPGPNNYSDEMHKKLTYQLIERHKKGMILYVLNATQLATDDDHLLLSKIVRESKKNKVNLEKQCIFVLNKIDGLDTQEEDLNIVIRNVQQYLSQYGIKKPHIIPLSAKMAYIVRKAEANKKLTDYEEMLLENKYAKSLYYTGITALECAINKKIEENAVLRMNSLMNKIKK